MQVAILRWDKVSDVLSLIITSLGIEFHVVAPLHMKRCFMLLVRGFGK